MPTPIQQIDRQQLPQTGRIRMGYTTPEVSKNGKKYDKPHRSDTFILSSSRVEDLEVLADKYGGTVKAWEDNKSQDRFRIKTKTDTLDVILHPSAIGEPSYQLWKGSQLERRCDGVTLVNFPKKTGQNPDPEPVTMECICNQLDRPDECKPKTHLSLMLPEVPLGVWRLVTSSNNALRELFGSIEVIRTATAVGYPMAQLRIDWRTGSDGRQYSVPVLTSVASMAEMAIAANSGPPGALPEASRPMLELVPPPTAVVAPEDAHELL